MPDVFISFTRAERDLTDNLARRLARAGFSVWWDADLFPGVLARRQIDTQIRNCSAAVTIWSTRSVESNWICSDAGDAMSMGKLVSVLHADMVPERLPKPFRHMQTVPLIDTEGIIDAIRRVSAAK